MFIYLFVYLFLFCSNCEANQGLYSAANLSVLIPGGNISGQIDRLADVGQVSAYEWYYLHDTYVHMYMCDVCVCAHVLY